MGNFRFYRRLRIFPGLSVNLSKSGPSLTVGMRGAHLTMGPRGVRRTVGIPGTGIYYTSHSGYQSGGLIALVVIVGIALIIGMAIGSASH